MHVCKRYVFSMLYCLCYAKDRNTDMSEDQGAEEIYPDLNEEEDIRLDEIREEHWKDVSEEVEYKKKIHYLRWKVYVKLKEELIKREFSVSVPHTKGGEIVWTCVKNHIIDEKEDYKDIGLCGFDYKLFEEEEGGGTREGLYGYHYLKHRIQLWLGDWMNHMERMNEAVIFKNRFTMYGGGKLVSSSFQKARVLEMYWLNYIGIFIWEERTQALE